MYSKRGDLLNSPNHELLDDFLIHELTIAELIRKYGYTRDVIRKFLEQYLPTEYITERATNHMARLNFGIPSWNAGVTGESSHVHGRDVSQETRLKISKANTGKRHSHTSATRQRISKTLSSKINQSPIGRQRWEQGWFSSKKNDKKFFYRSSFERSVIADLENSHSVHSYDVEPFCIQWQAQDGGARFYTPDILVNLSNGNRILIEIKPSFKVKRDEVVRAKIRAAYAWCRSNDCKFRLITEKNLNRVERIINAVG